MAAKRCRSNVTLFVSGAPSAELVGQVFSRLIADRLSQQESAVATSALPTWCAPAACISLQGLPVPADSQSPGPESSLPG